MDPTKWGAPYPLVVAALFVIVMARANGTYWLGRLAAAGTERTRMRKLLHAPGYVRAVRWIDRWGAPAVSVSFLTVGFRVRSSQGPSRMRLSPLDMEGALQETFVRAFSPSARASCSRLNTSWEPGAGLAISRRPT